MDAQKCNQKQVFELLIGSSQEFIDAMNQVKVEYGDSETERLDYVDISEPMKILASEFKNGNKTPIVNLFSAIDKHYDNCDDEGKSFVAYGIIESLVVAVDAIGMDARDCFKMELNQTVIPLWNEAIGIM